jgi:DNA-directed RNA polymerase sigma subunit (sigma70/sigma32)
MSSFVWPSDDGWPYPDTSSDLDVIDLDGAIDEDTIALRADAHLFASLSPLEHDVLCARYGLDGAPVRSMKQLHVDLGVPRADLRDALGTALAKVRAHLAD